MLRIVSLLCLLSLPVAADPLSVAGRLEKVDRPGGCSAVLVEPDVILTAAHCAPLKADVELHRFRLGDALGVTPVSAKSVAVHPLYADANARIAWKFRFDLAAVRLAEPVSHEIATPLPIGREAEIGETLFLVSWRDFNAPRPRQRACDVIPGVRGLITLACEVRGGESGAPVIRKTDDGLELVGIVSSRSRQRSQPTAQASNVRLRLPPILDILN